MNIEMKRLPFLLLLCALPAFGQGTRVDVQAHFSNGGIVNVIPNAPVTVCTAAATGIPCSPTTTVYSDIALTAPITQPFTSDAQGNIGFYVPTGGTYKYTINPNADVPSGAGPFTITPACTPSGNCTYSGNLTISGTTAFTPAMNCKQMFLQIRCVDGSTGGYAQTSAGVQQAINDLLAASSNGGKVLLAPGTYSISSMVQNNSNNVGMECMGGSGGSTQQFAAGGCIFNWTGGSSTGAMVDWSEAYPTGTNELAGGGVKGISFQCASKAAVGLHIGNIWYTRNEDNSFKNCTSTGVRVDTYAYNGTTPTFPVFGNRATQHNTFINTNCDMSLTAGACIWEGATTDAVANTAGNTFISTRCAFMGTGNCVLIDNADNSVYMNIAGSQISTGYAACVRLTGSVNNNQSAREIGIIRLDCVPGATFTGTVTVTGGTSVVLTAGTNFVTGPAWNGLAALINGVPANIAYVSSGTSLTLRQSIPNGTGQTFLLANGGVVQDGTSGGIASGNSVEDIGLCNGTPLPAIITGQVTYNVLDCAGVRTATYTPNIVPSRITSGGAAPTFTGTGSCVATGTQSGTWTGQIKCTTAGGAQSSTLVITPGTTAPNAWFCSGHDLTNAANLLVSAHANTSCTLSGTVTTNDFIEYQVVAY
jgi:hypothetical protein